MTPPQDDERKFAVSHVSYEPETTSMYVEVAIRLDGSWGTAASFPQGRRDLQENVALLRRAAELLLEHADTMLRHPEPWEKS